MAISNLWKIMPGRNVTQTEMAYVRNDKFCVNASISRNGRIPFINSLHDNNILRVNNDWLRLTTTSQWGTNAIQSLSSIKKFGSHDIDRPWTDGANIIVPDRFSVKRGHCDIALLVKTTVDFMSPDKATYDVNTIYEILRDMSRCAPHMLPPAHVVLNSSMGNEIALYPSRDLASGGKSNIEVAASVCDLREEIQKFILRDSKPVPLEFCAADIKIINMHKKSLSLIHLILKSESYVFTVNEICRSEVSSTCRGHLPTNIEFHELYPVSVMKHGMRMAKYERSNGIIFPGPEHNIDELRHVPSRTYWDMTIVTNPAVSAESPVCRESSLSAPTRMLMMYSANAV